MPITIKTLENIIIFLVITQKNDIQSNLHTDTKKLYR